MRNLVNLYSTVNPSIKLDGLLWYTNAHNECAHLANKYNKPLDVVCAIMSALSPGTNYEQNKRDLVAMVSGKQVHNYQTYRANVSKAKHILSGKLSPVNAFSLKTGAKTYNFYHNILEPNSPDYTTIDRHAYNLAMSDDYKSLTKNQYLKVASGYVRAAKKLNILPCQLQAVLWLDYREKQNIFFNKFDIVEVPF